MIKRLALNIGISMALVLVLFAACNPEESGNGEAPPTDDEIKTALAEQFEEAPGLAIENLSIEVTEGIVTLKGVVSSMLARKHASDLAQLTQGVRSVVNSMAIKNNTPDEVIQEDINEALSTDPATEPHELAAEVNQGTAILRGVVKSWQERQIAEYIAEGVRGVTNIDNRINIKQPSPRSDEDIKTDIREALQWDVRIDDGPIELAVDQGSVDIRGAVGSAQVKELVVDKAHVEGVKDVNADLLEVIPGLSDEMFRVEEPDMSDQEIEEAIQRAWKMNPRVSQYELSVMVEQGVATLSGKVDNLNSKLAAAQTVQNTVGVEAIDNNIEVEQKVVVRPDLETTDQAIKERVEAAIARDPYLEIGDITVKVTDGIVTLEGMVDSDFERDHAAAVVSNTVGVLTISNNIEDETTVEPNI